MATPVSILYARAGHGRIKLVQTLGNFHRRQSLLRSVAVLGFGASLALLAPLAGPGAVAQAAPAKAAKANEPAPGGPSDAVARQIQKALAESQTQLGGLEPWQEKLFQDEVIPQSQRFIRDYRRSRTGIDVDVDLDTMRNYLRFYAPKAFKRDTREAPVIIVGLAPGDDCEPCSARLPMIRTLVKDRLERRGFAVVFARSADPQLMSKLADEKKADGMFTAAWARAIADEIDAAHADGISYAIKCQLTLKEFPRQEGSLEIFETGSFEKSVGQLMTDFMTEIGSQVSKVASRSGEESQASGVSVEFRGIRNYGAYARLKDKLAALSESSGITFDERKVSAGKVVFLARPPGAASGDKGVESVRKALGGLVVESGPAPAAAAPPSNVTPAREPERYRIHVLNTGDRSLECELR